MRRSLDRIYLAAGWLAAGFILAIACLVSAQVLLNISTRVLGLPLPATIPSYADFAGFMLAGATFFAMPYTFRSAGHIRVSLLTARLPDRARWMVELAALALAAALLGYACWYIVALIRESLHFGDVSGGIVPVPLWIPQTGMGIGMGLLLVAVLDTLVETWARGRAVIDDTSEEI
ncbi:TRAP transporter small permease [Citreimonas sp.]|uniref:TRAP transporter small permease n=1 Tax=Citreimonas sp. TaxID=3036715 RepID=UPI00405879C9